MTVKAQVDAALEPFGSDPRPEQLPEMERRANEAFLQALRARGLASLVGYRVVIRVAGDGPTCFVTEPRGHSWPLPAFSDELERVVRKR